MEEHERGIGGQLVRVEARGDAGASGLDREVHVTQTARRAGDASAELAPLADPGEHRGEHPPEACGVDRR